MYLPQHILQCIQSLESAGYAAYAVGGCVRDALLGLVPQDYDLCTAAAPEQIKAVFAGHALVLAGEKHGTVGVITDGGVVEITAFRTEGDYADHRHPDSVTFVDTVEKDLARRDFTVNAMAFSPDRGFADPFGGCRDLKQGILRAVGDPVTRFREDALRILRGVRFSVRFALVPEPQTLQAMERLAPSMEHLARERVFSELCRLLPLADAAQLVRFGPILSRAIPDLAPCLGFDQRSSHHAYDLFTHIAHVVESVPPLLPLRWAALLHDIGKPDTFSLDDGGQGHFYNHAAVSADMADKILLELKAPTALREQAVLLIRHHMTKIPTEKKAVRRWLGRLTPQMLEWLLLLQEADMGSKGTGYPAEMAQFAEIRRLAAEILADQECFSLKDLAVNGRDLMALGLRGPAIGHTLSRLLEQVMDETLPNRRDALLEAARNVTYP